MTSHQSTKQTGKQKAEACLSQVERQAAEKEERLNLYHLSV